MPCRGMYVNIRDQARKEETGTYSGSDFFHRVVGRDIVAVLVDSDGEARVDLDTDLTGLE